MGDKAAFAVVEDQFALFVQAAGGNAPVGQLRDCPIAPLRQELDTALRLFADAGSAEALGCGEQQLNRSRMIDPQKHGQ